MHAMLQKCSVARAMPVLGNMSSVADCPALLQALSWRSLGTPAAELTLNCTLPTGQSFRWRRTGKDEYTGVIGQRVVRAGTGRHVAPCSVLQRCSLARFEARIHFYHNFGCWVLYVTFCDALDAPHWHACRHTTKQTNFSRQTVSNVTSLPKEKQWTIP